MKYLERNLEKNLRKSLELKVFWAHFQKTPTQEFLEVSLVEEFAKKFFDEIYKKIPLGILDAICNEIMRTIPIKNFEGIPKNILDRMFGRIPKRVLGRNSLIKCPENT